MSYLKKIVGDKVYLSPQGASDEEVKKFTEWLNDFSTTKYLGRSSESYTPEQERAYLESVSKDNTKCCFDIVTIKDDKLIGTISLEHIDWPIRNAVLGVFIGDPKFRSHGFGTEAVNLIVEFGFKFLNLHSIRLEVMATNERAHKCYQKCGFKDTGKTRDYLFYNGEYIDSLHMDILEDEFTGDFIRNKEEAKK